MEAKSEDISLIPVKTLNIIPITRTENFQEPTVQKRHSDLDVFDLVWGIWVYCLPFSAVAVACILAQILG